MEKEKLGILDDELSLQENTGNQGQENITVKEHDRTESKAESNESPPQNFFIISWKHWANETTLHGIKVISDDKEHKIKRILRFLTLCVFLGGLTYICYDQTVRYLEYNTVTKETIIFEEEIEFPAVTICNLEFLNQTTSIDVRELEALQYVYSWPRTEQEPSYFQYVFNSLRKILHEETSAREILSHCHFGRRDINCDDYFKYTQTNLGTCFTLNSIDDKMQFVTTTTGSDYGLLLTGHVGQGNFQLAHDKSVGFKVLVHPRNEQPDMTKAMTLAPGFTHYVAITKHEYTYLPSPVQAFNKKECIETNSAEFVSPLRYTSPYSRSACFQECIMLYVNSTCKCIGPFFLTGNGSTSFPECTPKRYVDCQESSIVNFTSTGSIQSCDCPIPCRSVQYETKLSSAYFPSSTAIGLYEADETDLLTIRQKQLQLRIYYDDKIVTVHKQVLEFEFADLLGSFGGYLGLALGASLLTILEIVEQVFVSCHSLYEKKRKVQPLEPK